MLISRINRKIEEPGYAIYLQEKIEKVDSKHQRISIKCKIDENMIHKCKMRFKIEWRMTTTGGKYSIKPSRINLELF